jgi:hypothetical protein
LTAYFISENTDSVSADDRLRRWAIRHLVALRDYIAEDSLGNAARVAERTVNAVELLPPNLKWDGLDVLSEHDSTTAAVAG